MKRYLAFLILAVGLIASLFFNIKQYGAINKFNNLVKQNKRVKQAVQAEATIIAQKVNKEGLKIATIEAAQAIIPSASVKEPAVSPGLIDTVSQAIGILKKQVQELTVVNTKMRAELLLAEKVINGKEVVYEYRDKWADIKFRPPADSISKGTFDLSYNADLTIAQYWKRKWILGAKRSYIDIYSNDPRTTIQSVKKLTVEQRQPLLGLRLQGVAETNLRRAETLAGPGLQFDIGRFSFKGAYMYNFKEENWHPILQSRFDLIRF